MADLQEQLEKLTRDFVDKVSAVESMFQNASSSDIESVLNRVKQIGRVPPGSVGAELAVEIDAIRREAEKEKTARAYEAAEQITETLDGPSAVSNAFSYDSVALNYMSANAKDLFKSGADYPLAKYDQNGNIVLSDTVDGQVLKNDQAMLVFYAYKNELSNEEKSKLRQAETPIPDLNEVQDSLGRLEDYSLAKLHARGASAQEISDMQNRFKEAHSQIETIRSSQDEIAKLKLQQTENEPTWKDQILITSNEIQLSYNNTQLERILKQEILEPLEKEGPAQPVSQREDFAQAVATSEGPLLKPTPIGNARPKSIETTLG